MLEFKMLGKVTKHVVGWKRNKYTRFYFMFWFSRIASLVL